MSEAKGKKILVTGALGQIGTELVDSLRDKHGTSSVIASDIRSINEQNSTSKGPYVTLDVLDTDSIIKLCNDEDIGTVYLSLIHI